MPDFFHWLCGDLCIEGVWYTKQDIKILFPAMTRKAMERERQLYEVIQQRDEAIHRSFLLAVENKGLRDATDRSTDS